MLHHKVANAGHRLAAGHEAGAGILVHHQIDVALAHLLLQIGHAVELVGHGAQALGQQANLGGLDRQLARLGLHQRALGTDDVAQIPLFKVVVHRLAHGIAGDVQLDAPGGILHRGKAGLAHNALEHHAPAHADGDGAGLQRFGVQRVVLRGQGGGAVLGFEVVGEGGNALGLGLLTDGFQFLTALGNEFVFILGGGSRIGQRQISGVRHGSKRAARGQG